MMLYGHAERTLVGTVVGLTLANTGVALRFIARWAGGFKITADDHLMLSALLPYWGMAIGGILITQNGLGQPLPEIAPDKLTNFFIIVFTETYFYVLSVALTKASILAMYWRVLPCEWTRRNVYVCGSIVLAWTVAVTIANSFACIPVQRIWNFGSPGKCFNWAQFYYGIQIPNILTDVYIVVIPLREVFGLKLTRPQKCILVGIFGIATLTIIFDVIRLVAMLEFNASHKDITVSIVDATVWTIVEPAVGIFAACLSSLRPLFRLLSHTKYFRRFRTTEASSQTLTIEAQKQAVVKKPDPTSISTDNDTVLEFLSGTIEIKGTAQSYSRSISSLG